MNEFVSRRQIITKWCLEALETEAIEVQSSDAGDRRPRVVLICSVARRQGDCLWCLGMFFVQASPSTTLFLFGVKNVGTAQFQRQSGAQYDCDYPFMKEIQLIQDYSSPWAAARRSGSLASSCHSSP